MFLTPAQVREENRSGYGLTAREGVSTVPPTFYETSDPNTGQQSPSRGLWKIFVLFCFVLTADAQAKFQTLRLFALANMKLFLHDKIFEFFLAFVFSPRKKIIGNFRYA